MLAPVIAAWYREDRVTKGRCNFRRVEGQGASSGLPVRFLSDGWGRILNMHFVLNSDLDQTGGRGWRA